MPIVAGGLVLITLLGLTSATQRPDRDSNIAAGICPTIIKMRQIAWDAGDHTRWDVPFFRVHCPAYALTGDRL